MSFTANLQAPDVFYDTSGVGAAEGQYLPVEELKDIVVDLPPGLVGNPLAAPRCSLAAFSATQVSGQMACPVGSQVGVFSSVPNVGELAAEDTGDESSPRFR